MAKKKRSSHSQPASTSRNAPSTSASFPDCLYQGIEKAARIGDWQRWLGSALETGDPQFWPKIRQLYQEHPHWRWTILFHLRIYWGEHEQMVAPLLREALRDPEQCAAAFEAVDTFPSAADAAIAALEAPECLQRVSRSALPEALACLKRHPDQAVALVRKLMHEPTPGWDSDYAEVVLAMAAGFPALTDDVLTCLRDSEFVRRVGLNPILSCLACQLRLTDGPADRIRTEWGWQGPLLDSLRAELKQRYNLDLDPASLPDHP